LAVEYACRTVFEGVPETLSKSMAVVTTPRLGFEEDIRWGESEIVTA
jgi:hypothetical protein